jgi:2-octaprenyl-6-methoxyphenol hydroxylase
MDEKSLTPSAIIVGAGPVGVLLALTLDQLGWKVTLLEKHPLNEGLPPSYDHRQIALTAGSVDWLRQQSWTSALIKILTPIHRIHSSSQGNFGILTMSHEEMEVEALGYTLSQAQLGEHLFAELATRKINYISNIQLSQLHQTAQQVHLTWQTFAGDHQEQQADYLFAADGAHSWIRSALNIPTQDTHYPHALMTAIAQLSEPHHYQAIERFTAQGPSALLPMTNPYQAKVVYCYPNELTDEMQQLTTSELTDCVNQQLGHQLGRIIHLSAIAHYPLKEIRAQQIQAGRCLLVGNAAHTQHPVAGQGLNLGIRDVIAVGDWAENPNEPSWQALIKQRTQDHQQTMNFTHGLIQLFTHKSPLVRQAATLGMSLLSAFPPIKHRITRMAMGY